MSILGGVVAATALALWFGIRPPSLGELVGAGLLVAAIGVLWIGPRMSHARTAQSG
jgi:hypothetical protein